jgi:hypothetical protein
MSGLVADIEHIPINGKIAIVSPSQQFVREVNQRELPTFEKAGK